MTFDELESSGEGFDVSESVDAVGPDDLLTLIYTSGTTGPPKGVQLSHRNLMSLVSGIDDMIDFPEAAEGHLLAARPPTSPSAARTTTCRSPGACRSRSARIRARSSNSCRVSRPTWFFAVPRIWEKLKAGLEAKFASMPDEQREPAQKGLEAAIQKVRLEQAGEEVPEELAASGRAGRRGDVLRAAQDARSRPRRFRSTSAPPRPPSRCSSSSTRSGSRSASCGACPRPAAPRP